MSRSSSVDVAGRRRTEEFEGARSGPAGRRAAVFGGGGHFGRLVVDDLLAGSDLEVTVVSRSGGLRRDWPRDRVRALVADQHDRNGSRRILEGAAVVVCAAGPSLPAALAAHALVQGTVARGGVLALHEAVGSAAVLAGLEARGLELWARADEGTWRRTSAGGERA